MFHSLEVLRPWCVAVEPAISGPNLDAVFCLFCFCKSSANENAFAFSCSCQICLFLQHCGATNERTVVYGVSTYKRGAVPVVDIFTPRPYPNLWKLHLHMPWPRPKVLGPPSGLSPALLQFLVTEWQEVQKEDTKGSPIQQPSSCICLQKNQLQNSLRIPGSIWEGYVFCALWQVVWTSKTMDNSGLEYSFPIGTSVCLGCVLFLSVVIFPTGFASKVKLIPLRPMSASRGMYRAKWSWRECQVPMTLQIKHGKGKNS